MHDRLCVIMHPLSPSRSTLLNGVSSHVVADAITLTQIDQMQRGAQTLHPRMPMYIGSIDGKIRVSARLEVAGIGSTAAASTAPEPPPPQSSGKKRQRVSESEQRANAVIAGVRKRLNGSASQVSEEQLETGKQVVRQLVELTGSGGESVLEAVGLSVAAASAQRQPRLMLSARFTPGIAIPLKRLRSAIATCNDGAVTTTTSGLGNQFALPEPANAAALAADGQLPIFLHTAIPEPQPQPANAVPPKPAGLGGIQVR